MAGLTVIESLTLPNAPWLSAHLCTRPGLAGVLLQARCIYCEGVTERPYCCVDTARSRGWRSFIQLHAGCSVRALAP